jgi:hypothetical protein
LVGSFAAASYFLAKVDVVDTCDEMFNIRFETPSAAVTGLRKTLSTNLRANYHDPLTLSLFGETSVLGSDLSLNEQF